MKNLFIPDILKTERDATTGTETGTATENGSAATVTAIVATETAATATGRSHDRAIDSATGRGPETAVSDNVQQSIGGYNCVFMNE